MNPKIVGKAVDAMHSEQQQQIDMQDPYGNPYRNV
jgi:hypothetical protein